MPVGVAKGHAMGTDRSLHHKAFVRSGPNAGAVLRTPQQRVIGLGPDCTPPTTSLLHTHWQGVRGWVYNGFGRTVVEQGVVARVTMITIDE